MIRTSEAVLPGHPDKFCDQVADLVIAEALKLQKNAYAQIEAAVWSDIFWLNGAIVTEEKFEPNFKELVVKAGVKIGYTPQNHIDATKYKVNSEICLMKGNPDYWGKFVNDQSIVVGWAGYDEKTRYLPPEHFLVNFLSEKLSSECLRGDLKGLGPDGKIMAIVEEKKNSFNVRYILISLQNRDKDDFLELLEKIIISVRKAYSQLRLTDARWIAKPEELKICVNPAGNFINSGSDGDNGQTGRKLTMDFYGPRIPIGGGALSGKHMGHIDRLAAYTAREAAIKAVKSGAKECLIRLVYAPEIKKPLKVLYSMKGKGERMKKSFFEYERMLARYSPSLISQELAMRSHFYDLSFPWNSGR